MFCHKFTVGSLVGGGGGGGGGGAMVFTIIHIVSAVPSLTPFLMSCPMLQGFSPVPCVFTLTKSCAFSTRSPLG